MQSYINIVSIVIDIVFFTSQPEDGHCQVPKHVVVVYVVYSIHTSTII